MATVAVVCGIALAAHHPLAPALAMSAFACAAVALALSPTAWLAVLPALLPWLGLAPWTGWVTFEEFDLLLLAVAAGGYARWAFAAGPHEPSRPMPGTWLLMAFWTISAVVSFQRGVADAGGWQFEWFQGYRGPMNALRLLKPTLALVVLLPLWRRAQSFSPLLASDRLLLGMTLGHLGAALICVAERHVYAGLGDFSSDYRTTGSFWEMHVGGAALDGFLALTMPFALRVLLQSRGAWSWGLAALTLVLGSYAALTTFSRILLAALPLGLLLTFGLTRWQQARSRPASAARGEGARVALRGLGWFVTLALPATVVYGLVHVFPTSGYRGMLALVSVAAAVLVAVPRTKALRGADLPWLAGCLAGAGAVVWAVATWVPKGPYWAAYASASAGVVLAWGWPDRRWSRIVVVALVPAVFWGALQACVHWGGDAARLPASTMLAALAVWWLVGSCLPAASWPEGVKRQGGLAVAMAVAAIGVGVFSGGGYLAGRLDTVGADREGRMQHWRASLGRLPDMTGKLLGLGLGRYLDAYVRDPQMADRAGDHRFLVIGGQPELRLIGGVYERGWGELLRVSQRIERPHGAMRSTLVLRNPGAEAKMQVEVCIKHLIYILDCRYSEFAVPAAPDWQTFSFDLPGGGLPADEPTRPRATIYSIGVLTSTHPLSFRQVSLRDHEGREFLSNGRFEQGGARWFFSSDRHHMPWHAKNMAVHTVFEQGFVGLAALLAMSLLAIGRTAWGRSASHPLAPALVGGLLGLWMVGMVDSLLDMPRVATLILLMCGFALTLTRRRLA